MNSELPGALRSDITPSDTEVVGKLNIETGHWFFLYGLIGETPTDMFSADIKKQVRSAGGDGVANLVYESQAGCLDLVVGQLTCGLVYPHTYKVSGDIVRIKKSALPGTALSAAQQRPQQTRLADNAQQY